MSDDRNGRKTLLPEFLPAPGSRTVLSPKERVAERARIFLQRFRGLGTTTGAAILSLQCSGYGVVDPLPPPPMQCNVVPDLFPQLHATGYFGSGQDGGTPPLILDLSSSYYPSYVGFRIEEVRVTGGALISVDDLSRSGQGGGTRFLISLAPAPGAAELRVDVDLGCGTAAATKHYRVTYQRPGSQSQAVTVDELVDTTDAGASSQ